MALHSLGWPCQGPVPQGPPVAPCSKAAPVQDRHLRPSTWFSSRGLSQKQPWGRSAHHLHHPGATVHSQSSPLLGHTCPTDSQRPSPGAATQGDAGGPGHLTPGS